MNFIAELFPNLSVFQQVLAYVLLLAAAAGGVSGLLMLEEKHLTARRAKRWRS